jgi:hypothetical protein
VRRQNPVAPGAEEDAGQTKQSEESKSFGNGHGIYVQSDSAEIKQLNLAEMPEANNL